MVVPRQSAARWLVALLALSAGGGAQRSNGSGGEPSARTAQSIQRPAPAASVVDEVGQQTAAAAAPGGRSLAAADASSVVFDSASAARRSEWAKRRQSAAGAADTDQATPVSRSARQRRKAIREDIYYWLEAKIPYSIDSSIDGVSTEARSKIENAIAQWERMTCIRFVPYNATVHPNALVFLKGLWCASKLGMTGGLQPLYLAAGCLTIGTIVHEIGHSVGWVHEQTRPDRDEHVDINWSIVSPLYRPQYDKYSSAYVNTYGIPYDHSSIMHYPSYGELSARDSSKQAAMGQRERLSFYDAKLANAMYKCAERRGCDTSNVECTGDGYVGPDCKCVCRDGSERCAASNEIGMPPVMDGPAAAAERPLADEDPDAAAVARRRDACQEWNRVENTFIVGHNDDVVFGVGVDECKARCEGERSFLCLSVNYWRERRHCYLSSASKRTHRQVALAHDERILHFERNVCGASGVSGRPPPQAVGNGGGGDSTPRPPLPPPLVSAVAKQRSQHVADGATQRPPHGTDGAKRRPPENAVLGGQVQTRRQQQPPQQQQPPPLLPRQQQPRQQQPQPTQPPQRPQNVVDTASTVAARTTTVSASVATPVGRRYSVKCSPEYSGVRDACLRFVHGTQRPAQLATHECENRLQARLWSYTEALKGPLASLLPDGEYWVDVENYKSDNSLAGFFRFCPYVLKENGVVVLSDSFCHRKKGFICAGQPIRTSFKEAPLEKKVRHPSPLPR